MRFVLVSTIALLMAGCLAEPVDPVADALGYLGNEPAQSSATTALVARAVAAHGVDLGSWPSSEEPLLDDLAIEPYAAALHGLLATQDDAFVHAVWAGHDGAQFGSPHLLTDDMMAVAGLLAAGAARDDGRLVDAVERIRVAQDAGGGWRYDGAGAGEVDETAWALQALVAAGALEPASRQAAVDFLVNARVPSGLYAYGGTPNCQSTAWALVAWSTLNMEAPSDAPSALLGCQNDDGGFGFTPGAPSQPWVTADALLALAA